MSATRVTPRPPAAADRGSGRGRLWATVALVVVVLGAAVWVACFTGVLGVRTVAVTGTRALTADDVRAAAAVRDGEPLSRVDTAEVATRVSALPGISRVAVTRSWPGTLRIAVTERTAVAVLPRDRATWLIDGEGVVFQRVAVRPKALPRLDVRAAGPADPATAAALGALGVLPASVARQVLVLAAVTPDSVTLTLTGKRTVIWGGADEAAAKARVLPALLGRPGRIYDVSTPTVVTVR